jgi:hypothetical protein
METTAELQDAIAEVEYLNSRMGEPVGAWVKLIAKDETQAAINDDPLAPFMNLD